MANEENLRPFTSDQSREEAAKNGRKGGIKSGESRREKKQFAELLAMVDAMPMKSKGFTEGLRQLGIPEDVIENLDQKMAKVFALQRRCLSGDPQAIKLWLEQIGEYTETLNVNSNGEAPLADGAVRFTSRKKE